jgi:putative phage-type endonuclease
MTEKQRIKWLQDRKLGLGGTDLTVLMGASKYATPLDIYLSKTTNVIDETNEKMETGKILEDYVAERYALEYNLNVFKPERNIYIGKKSYYRGSIDRLYKNGGYNIIEVKTTQMYLSEIPDSYYIQANWYAGIMNAEHIDIVILRLPRAFNYKEFVAKCIRSKDKNWYKPMLDLTTELQVFNFQTDWNLIERMERVADNFWNNHIVTKIAPSENIPADYIPKLHPIPKYSSKDISGDLVTKIIIAKDLQQEITKLTKELTTIKDIIRVEMADYEQLTYKGKVLAVYPKSQKTKFNVKLFEQENPKVYDKYVEKIETRGNLLIK